MILKECSLIDSGLSSGAGTDTMMLALPVSLFDGFDSQSLVYLYAKHGELGTSDSQRGVSIDGFEYSGGGFFEWAAYTEENTDEPPDFTIPEPGGIALLLTGALPLLMRRRRSE